MARLPRLALTLVFASACGSEQPASEAAPAEPPASVIDQALLTNVIAEAVEVEGDRVTADGLLVRLAFEPLIRQTGPVSLQLMQSTGYRLNGLAEGSPLWLLGLRDGDVLTTVEGQPIIGREHELRSQWERRPLSVDIGYLRGDQARILSLRVRPGVSWKGSDTISTLVTPRPRPGPDPSGDPLGVEPNDPELDAGIRCNPGTAPDVLATCEFERSAIDRLLANPGNMVKQARIVPRTQDGEVSGFKLYGIRASSVASVLGLQNGDVVVAVDGKPLTSVDEAMVALLPLTKAKTNVITLTIERSGALSKLEIKIVDAAK